MNKGIFLLYIFNWKIVNNIVSFPRLIIYNIDYSKNNKIFIQFSFCFCYNTDKTIKTSKYRRKSVLNDKLESICRFIVTRNDCLNFNDKWGWNNVDAIIKKQNIQQIENSYLHTFNQTLHIISQTFNSLIIRSSMQGVFEYVSPNSVQILGYTSKELIGKKITNFLHERDQQRLLQICEKPSHLWDEEKILNLRLKKQDGMFIWSEVRIYILKDIKQNPREIMYMIKEKPLDDANLLETDKMSLIGQLAAGVAHEIRNPLTSIKGFIQLMKSDTKKNDQYLAILEQEIDRINSITNEMMFFAKPNHSKFEYYDLKSILQSCLTLLDGVAYQKQIHIMVQYCDEPIKVFCDEQKIKQVIINLIKNALESMENPGKIIIELNKINNYSVLSITDEGCGIPQELIEKLGQPFLTTKSNGNGLGLMMCYKIIEQHEGKIEVQSELGIGTTFNVFLPIESE